MERKRSFGPCATCEYWLLSDKEAKQGICRRYPPRPLITGHMPVPNVLNPQGPPQMKPVIQAMFPVTMETTECGEHDTKKQLDA